MNHFELLIYRSRHQELAVRNQTFHCKQGTACTHQIRWSGKNTPTFSTSDTLPDGYTMTSAGVLSYDGTACTPNTYNIDVVADDGETTVTATMTINVAYATLIFEAQSIKFKGGESESVTLECTSDFTLSFTVTSGTLPAGVTLASDGTLSYDGTYTQDIETSVSITASAQFAQPVTATISFKIAMSLVPDDYDWYTPFIENFTDEVSGITGVPFNNEYFHIVSDTRFGGYLNVTKTVNSFSGLDFPGTANFFQYGTGPFSISFWFNGQYWNNYTQILLGNRNGDGNYGFVLFKDHNDTLDVRIGQDNNDRRTDNFAKVDEWHQYTFVRSTGDAWTWYKDGVAVTTGTGAGNSANATNNSSQVFKVGGGNNWWKQAYFKICHLRIYGRALNSDEIDAIASEFPTNAVFDLPLTDSTSTVDIAGGKTMTIHGTPADNTIDGLSCVRLPDSSAYYTTSDTSIGTALPTGRHSFTQSIWINIENWANKGAFFAFGTNNAYQSIHLQGQTQGNINGGGWYLDYSFNYTFQLNTWYHLLQTYDGVRFRSYVNGVLTNSSNNTNVNVGTGGIGIGIQSTNSEESTLRPLNVKAARIYDRVLTQSEITELANEFTPSSSN